MTIGEDGYLLHIDGLLEHQKVTIRESVSGTFQDYDEVLAQLPRTHPSQVDLMEIGCPANSGLSWKMSQHGGVSARVGLHNHDLSTKYGLNGALAMAERLRPRFMWISTPCGPFSPIQALFKEKPEIQKEKSLKRQRRARKIIRSAVQLALQQIERGGDLGWEWPANWHEPEVRKLLKVLAKKGLLYTTLLDG